MRKVCYFFVYTHTKPRAVLDCRSLAKNTGGTPVERIYCETKGVDTSTMWLYDSACVCTYSYFAFFGKIRCVCCVCLISVSSASVKPTASSTLPGRRPPFRSTVAVDHLTRPGQFTHPGSGAVNLNANDLWTCLFVLCSTKYHSNSNRVAAIQGEHMFILLSLTYIYII